MYIFDYIVEQSHIDFISDMRKLSKPEIYNILKTIDYVGTKEEWEELISYLTSETYVSKSTDDAKEYIMRWLSR